ncbi:MAG: radical SAM protein [Patescibacteria group bacterium]|jgi:radical SAM superfamily enzyme YgiQ (UPF0313 family)
MNILLIHPKLNYAPSPRFPLGLGYIASALRDEGHSIEVIDLNAQAELENCLGERIKTGNFDLVGLTAMITQFRDVERLSSLIKKSSGSKIVIGGGLASAIPEMLLKETKTDIVVMGEGEKTIVEIAERIAHGQSIQNISGIAYRKGERVMKNPLRGYIDDISSLSFPAWDLFPVEHYFNNNVMCMPKRRISIITSRGCPYQCTFCFHGIFGHRYRARTAGNVFQEIELLYQKYKVRGFVIEDDTFILDKNRVYKLCDLIIKNKLRIYWSCNARVDLVDEEFIRKIKSAGCVEIAYGIESGNQGQLDKIKKGVTLDQAYKTIKLTKKAGILTHGFVMLNTPGETVETINDSINFCKKAGLQAEFTILTPIPGSTIYAEAVKANIISEKKLVENWGSWLDKVLSNFSTLSDEALIGMKRRAESEIFRSIYKRNMKDIFLMFFLEFKINGFLCLLKRVKRGLRVAVRAHRGLGLKESPQTS